MPKNTHSTVNNLVRTDALLNDIENEFVEIPLGENRDLMNASHRPKDPILTVEEDIFSDNRKVVSAFRTPTQKSTLVLSNQRENGDACCRSRNCCVGISSAVFLLMHKLPLSYAFLRLGTEWTYGVAPTLLLLSFIHDYLVTSSRVHELLNRNTRPDTSVLYQKGLIPQLPSKNNDYGVGQLIFDSWGMLASAILFGYAEAKILSPTSESLSLDIIFTVLAGIARILDSLATNSIATLSHHLLQSETARAAVFPAFIAECGSRIIYYRHYLGFLKNSISMCVCCFLVVDVALSYEFVANTLMGGAFLFLGLWAVMGENYRANRLNSKKPGQPPKNKCDQVIRQLLNISLPYHLMEGITSIYQQPFLGSQKVMYAIPVLVLMASLIVIALSLTGNIANSFIGNLPIPVWLFGTSTMMTLLATFSFIRIRYESALALISAQAYDSLLSAYWLSKLSQHPLIEKLLVVNTINSTLIYFFILLTGFTLSILTTSHTIYFTDQIVAEGILAEEKKERCHSTLQMRKIAKSIDTPPSWKHEIFKNRSDSCGRVNTRDTAHSSLEAQRALV